MDALARRVGQRVEPLDQKRLRGGVAMRQIVCAARRVIGTQSVPVTRQRCKGRPLGQARLRGLFQRYPEHHPLRPIGGEPVVEAIQQIHRGAQPRRRHARRIGARVNRPVKTNRFVGVTSRVLAQSKLEIELPRAVRKCARLVFAGKLDQFLISIEDSGRAGDQNARVPAEPGSSRAVAWQCPGAPVED